MYWYKIIKMQFGFTPFTNSEGINGTSYTPSFYIFCIFCSPQHEWSQNGFYKLQPSLITILIRLLDQLVPPDRSLKKIKTIIICTIRSYFFFSEMNQNNSFTFYSFSTTKGLWYVGAYSRPCRSTANCLPGPVAPWLNMQETQKAVQVFQIVLQK